MQRPYGTVIHYGIDAMGFLNTLRAEHLPGEGRWKLLYPLFYVTRKGDQIVVPAGYVTDLYTTPRWLWSVFPRDGGGLRAPVLHDYLCTNGPPKYSRATADLMFREALEEEGRGWLPRWTMWAGARIGGWF
jgi:hypothetical protein